VIRRRFKYFMPERNAFSSTGEETLLSVSEYYGVKPRTEAFDDESAESRAESLEGYRIVRAGDFVMNYMLAWKGAYGVSDYDGIVSPAYAVYKIDPTYADRRFIHHRLRSDHMRSVFRARSKGIIESRLRLYPDAFLSMELELPDLDTQKAIADFLDGETAHIDRLIEKKQRFVRLLEEREQNNLIHVFAELTRQNQIWKLSHLCLLQRGRFNHRPRNAPELYDGDHPFLQTGDVARAKKYIRSYKQTLTDLGASVSARFPKGTVMMAIAANVGDVAISEFDAFCPDSVVGFIPSKRLDKEFLYYSLRSLRSSIATSSTSNAQDNTNIARLGALKIPLPDLSVQRQVVENLNHAETRNYSLASSTDQSVERLQEFRSALITAAVTGQIDVKTWGKKSQTDRRLDQIQEAMGA
jgi:type I restriction enzyme, S subunit